MGHVAPAEHAAGPRWRRSSRCALATSSASLGSRGRKAMPAAYAALAGQVEVDDLPEEAVGDLDQDAGAVAGVDLGCPTRRGARGCRARRCRAATISWLRRPFMSTTKVTPQASCSKRGVVQALGRRQVGPVPRAAERHGDATVVRCAVDGAVLRSRVSHVASSRRRLPVTGGEQWIRVLPGRRWPATEWGDLTGGTAVRPFRSGPAVHLGVRSGSPTHRPERVVPFLPCPPTGAPPPI